MAFHVNGEGYNGEGINYVEFAVDGGPWVKVEKASMNPRTRVKEWWVNLDASKFSRDKKVELRARIVPKHGLTRVITFSDIYANARGTYDTASRVLPVGTHAIDASTITNLPDIGYYTIRAAPGTNRDDVKVKVNGEIKGKGNLKFEGVTIISPDYYESNIRTLVDVATEKAVTLWFDDVYAHGPLTDTTDSPNKVGHVELFWHSVRYKCGYFTRKSTF